LTFIISSPPVGFNLDLRELYDEKSEL